MAMDLTDLDGDFKDTAPATGGGGEVPDGKYVVFVEKTELRAARSDTSKRMLSWQFRILRGAEAGRCIFHRNMLTTPENLAWVKRDLETCSLKLAKLSDLPKAQPKLIGIKVEVQVKTKGENVNTYLNKLLGRAEEKDMAAAIAKRKRVQPDESPDRVSDDIPF